MWPLQNWGDFLLCRGQSVSTDELNAVDIDMLDVAWDIESLIFLKKVHFISCRHWEWSATRWVNNTLGSNHWLAIEAMWAGDLLAQAWTSQIVSIWQDHKLGNCSRSLAIKSLTLLIPSLLVPKILFIFLTSEHKLFFSGFVLMKYYLWTLGPIVVLVCGHCLPVWHQNGAPPTGIKAN